MSEFEPEKVNPSTVPTKDKRSLTPAEKLRLVYRTGTEDPEAEPYPGAMRGEKE